MAEAIWANTEGERAPNEKKTAATDARGDDACLWRYDMSRALFKKKLGDGEVGTSLLERKK